MTAIIAQTGPPAARPAPAAAPPLPEPTATATLAGPAPRGDNQNFTYVQYTARLLVPNGSFMGQYATTSGPGSAGTLYTHGVTVGRQTDHFKNGVYLGFGTEYGGPFGSGTDTLLRYELSWQSIWAPLGPMHILSPYVGFRLGGMGVKSERLTGGSLKPGVVVAPMAGLDVQMNRWVLVTGGIGYDANIGPDLGPNASVSGFAFDLGAAVRF
jgi:hypothetical protein